MKTFFNFLVEKEYLAKNPVTTLKSPKIGKKLSEFLSQEEVDILIENIENLRDKAIVALLYATGLRLFEVISLNRKDVQENTIEVIGKSNKERVVLLNESARKSLQDYLNNRTDDAPALFVTNRGRISRGSVQQMVKRYGKTIGKNIHSQIFCHSFADHLIKHGAGLMPVQELRDHKSVATIQTYTHVTKRHLKDIYDYIGESLKMTKETPQIKNGFPWHIVEQAIQKEVEWLKTSVIPFIKVKEDWFLYSYRKIAEMIVTDKIHAKEFTAKPGADLWGGFTKSKILPSSHRHGKEWHRKMMAVLTEYFESNNFEVKAEPWLNLGRADLGVYKKDCPVLFIEIGTTSPYKLMVNLSTTLKSIFLIVTNETQAIEFKSCK